MDHHDRIPDAVVRRLPGYYRHLRELDAEGIIRLSSQALGRRMSLTASQIRQDINYFGGFGQQGYGYNVQSLKRRIGQILGVDKIHHMVIVGAGNIGRAVADYPTFRNEGFQIQALFDIDPSQIGKMVRDAPVLPLEQLAGYLKNNPIDILLLATPAESAPDILEMAIEARIPALWNFAPVDLAVPDWMEIATVHLSDSLMSLSFRLHERKVRTQENPTWIEE